MFTKDTVFRYKGLNFTVTEDGGVFSATICDRDKNKLHIAKPAFNHTRARLNAHEWIDEFHAKQVPAWT